MVRQAICRAAGIDPAVMHRFMVHKVGLSMPTLDVLADVLDLDLTARGGPAKAGRARR